MTSAKSYDKKKNTISRLFAIQALFQMEANGKSYSTIKKELKETFYMHQIPDTELLMPNYSLSQKIIEQATKNQRNIDIKINTIDSNRFKLKLRLVKLKPCKVAIIFHIQMIVDKKNDATNKVIIKDLDFICLLSN